MKKINIIKSNDEYNRIIKTCHSYKYNDYVVYYEKNNDVSYHFGFSVGKKIGHAVTRNKIKRQTKAILDKYTFKNGFNCIIMVRKGILSKSFIEMEKDLDIVLKKINIIKEKNNEEKNR